VRLAPDNAKVLFELVKAEGVLKTKVSITGDERIALARADKQLTQGGARPTGRGTGLPPQYSPREEDVRDRYVAPREGYDRRYGHDRAQPQPQFYYDGYQWRPYNGQAYRAQPQPRYGGYYAQPQYYYHPRYAD
jgi:hypothetical protein